jgi:mannitol-1-phosphate/altronate dehydrogenase
VRDPLLDQLKAANGVDQLLALRDVFSEKLAGDARFRDALTDAYDHLTKVGSRAAVRDFVS